MKNLPKTRKYVTTLIDANSRNSKFSQEATSLHRPTVLLPSEQKKKLLHLRALFSPHTRKLFWLFFFSRAPQTRSHFSVRFFPRFLVSNCKLTARRQRFSDKWSRRKQRDSITRLINFHFAFYFSSDVDCIVVK